MPEIQAESPRELEQIKEVDQIATPGTEAATPGIEDDLPQPPSAADSENVIAGQIVSTGTEMVVTGMEVTGTTGMIVTGTEGTSTTEEMDSSAPQSREVSSTEPIPVEMANTPAVAATMNEPKLVAEPPVVVEAPPVVVEAPPVATTEPPVVTAAPPLIMADPASTAEAKQMDKPVVMAASVPRPLESEPENVSVGVALAESSPEGSNAMSEAAMQEVAAVAPPASDPMPTESAAVSEAMPTAPIESVPEVESVPVSISTAAPTEDVPVPQDAEMPSNAPGMMGPRPIQEDEVTIPESANNGAANSEGSVTEATLGSETTATGTEATELVSEANGPPAAPQDDRVFEDEMATAPTSNEPSQFPDVADSAEKPTIESVNEPDDTAVAEPSSEVKDSNVSNEVSVGEMCMATPPEGPADHIDEEEHRSDCDSVPADVDLEGKELELQHSVSAVNSATKEKRKKRKPKYGEFVKPPMPSAADAGANKEANSVRGPSLFEVQPRATRVADTGYNVQVESRQSASLYEKPAAPSRADVSALESASARQKRSVFASSASPSMADAQHASPLPHKPSPSLFVSAPRESTADTGANAAPLNKGSDVTKSVFESPAQPSVAAVRAVDPVRVDTSKPSVFSKEPAASKATIRASDAVPNSDAKTFVYESAPQQTSVSAKWSDPVTVKQTASVFESQAAPSRADAAANRDLESDDEYETDSESTEP